MDLQTALELKLDQLEKLKDFAMFSAGVDDVNVILSKRTKKKTAEE